MHKKSFGLFLLLFIFDWMTKQYLNQAHDLFSIFSWGVAVKPALNTGLSWGLAVGWNNLIALAATAFILWFLSIKMYGKNEVAAILVAAGGIGNLLDRMVYGGVRDFIALTYKSQGIFPIFNCADIFLTIGIILLIWNDRATLFSE